MLALLEPRDMRGTVTPRGVIASDVVFWDLRHPPDAGVGPTLMVMMIFRPRGLLVVGHWCGGSQNGGTRRYHAVDKFVNQAREKLEVPWS